MDGRAAERETCQLSCFPAGLLPSFPCALGHPLVSWRRGLRTSPAAHAAHHGRPFCRAVARVNEAKGNDDFFWQRCLAALHGRHGDALTAFHSARGLLARQSMHRLCRCFAFFFGTNRTVNRTVPSEVERGRATERMPPCLAKKTPSRNSIQYGPWPYQHSVAQHSRRSALHYTVHYCTRSVSEVRTTLPNTPIAPRPAPSPGSASDARHDTLRNALRHGRERLRGGARIGAPALFLQRRCRQFTIQKIKKKKRCVQKKQTDRQTTRHLCWQHSLSDTRVALPHAGSDQGTLLRPRVAALAAGCWWQAGPRS